MKKQFRVGDTVILKSQGWKGEIEKVNKNGFGEGRVGYFVFFPEQNIADWFSPGSLMMGMDTGNPQDTDESRSSEIAQSVNKVLCDRAEGAAIEPIVLITANEMAQILNEFYHSTE